ncbi:MAG: polysaccharide biosynthesis/export family protein [Thermodesulfobacteriota bacterium]
MFLFAPLGRPPFEALRKAAAPIGMVVVATLCIIAMFGCAGKSPNADKSKEGIQPVPPEFFNPYYPSHAVTIEPGDVLTVRFYYHPELDSTQAVRPDGKISLTLFQGIDVAGKSPEELQRHLTEVYAKEFVNPVISVEIEKKSSTTVFVSGQVAQGGVKPLQSNSTIGQILAQSAVRERDADLGSVVLVRKHGDTDYTVYKVDARFENGAERDIYLAPGDMIIVPRNAITILGDFVQKYLRDIIPPQMNIYYGLTTDLTNKFLFN